MPNINPPLDEQAALEEPAVRCGDGDVRITGRRVAPTLPVPCGYRFAVVADDDGREYAGYLWERDGGQPPEPAAGGPPCGPLEYKTAGVAT